MIAYHNEPVIRVVFDSKRRRGVWGSWYYTQRKTFHWQSESSICTRYRVNTTFSHRPTKPVKYHPITAAFSDLVTWFQCLLLRSPWIRYGRRVLRSNARLLPTSWFLRPYWQPKV